MNKIYKLLIQCPVEILMSIFFLGYLYKYGPFYETAGEWTTQTKDCLMTVGLLVTMMVRIVVSKFTSLKYGIIASVITGLVVTALLFLGFVVDSHWILPCYLICVVVCSCMVQHNNIEEQISKMVFLLIPTIVVALFIRFLVSFVLEVTKECLGPGDAAVADAYALVGGTACFVVGYQIVNEIRFKKE